MGQRAWRNLVLAFAVVGLALLAYFEPGMNEGASVGAPLSSLTADGASTVRFQRQGQEAVVLDRRGEQWWLQSPVSVPASQFQVSRLFELIGAESVKHYAVADLDLSQYGLLPPQVSLSVDGQSFAFGTLSPVNYQRYVLLGQTLHLINVSDLSVFTGGWVNLVDLQLLPKGAALARIVITGVGELVSEAGRWHLRGDAEEVSPDALVTLVDAWRYAQAFKVSSFDLAEEGETVLVQLVGAESPITFHLSKRDDVLILGRKDLGIQYHLSLPHASQLLSFSVDEV